MSFHLLLGSSLHSILDLSLSLSSSFDFIFFSSPYWKKKREAHFVFHPLNHHPLQTSSSSTAAAFRSWNSHRTMIQSARLYFILYHLDSDHPDARNQVKIEFQRRRILLFEFWSSYYSHFLLSLASNIGIHICKLQRTNSESAKIKTRNENAKNSNSAYLSCRRKRNHSLKFSQSVESILISPIDSDLSWSYWWRTWRPTPLVLLRARRVLLWCKQFF